MGLASIDQMKLLFRSLQAIFGEEREERLGWPRAARRPLRQPT